MTLELKNIVFDKQVFFHFGRSYLGLEICKLQSWIVLPALIKAEGSRAAASLSDSFGLLEHCLFECLQIAWHPFTVLKVPHKLGKLLSIKLSERVSLYLAANKRVETFN